MREQKSMVELMQITKCSLRIVWTLPSARRCISRGHKHVHVLRTKDGAHVSLFSSDEGYIRVKPRGISW